jgi:hypothetical protein
MARALETDPINQLEENLQCTVCLEVLTDPRTLPCFHSFCKVCLERIVETLRNMSRMSDRPQQISSQQRSFCSNDGKLIEARESQENQRQNVVQ